MKKKTKKLIRNLIILVIIVGGVVGVVSFSGKGSNKALSVTVEKAKRGDITSVVTATGKIYPETEVKISSEVAGEIIELPVKDGQKVNKGDLLVSVNPDTLEAQVKQQEASLSATRASAAQANASLLQARLDLERTESLHEKGFASPEQLDQAKTQLQIAEASYEAATHRINQQEMQLQEAQEELSKASTFSPINGTVTVLNSELGDRVVGTGQFSGTEIMRIADLDRMEVRVDVSEAEIVDVKIGDEADIEIDALPDETFYGRVTEIANSANTARSGTQEQLTTFEVKVQLNEPDPRVRPGMTATADIETQTNTGVVLVPLQSVTVRRSSEVKAQLNESDETEGKDGGAEARPDETAADQVADTESGSDEDSADKGKGDGEDGEERERDELQRVVFLVEDNVAKLKVVETGLADKRNIEIVSGVAEGESIVTGSYSVLTRELKHNSEVTIEEKKERFGRGRE